MVFFFKKKKNIVVIQHTRETKQKERIAMSIYIYLSVFFKLVHYFPVLEIKFIKIVIVLLKMLMGAKLFIGPLGAGRGTLHLNFFFFFFFMRLHFNLT